MTALHCTSRSWQFLATFADRPESADADETLLVGVVHGNVHRDRKGRLDPPRIVWDGPGAHGGLILSGCALPAPAPSVVRPGVPRLGGRVLVGAQATRVIDHGTHGRNADNPFIRNERGDPLAGPPLRSVRWTRRP